MHWPFALLHVTQLAGQAEQLDAPASAYVNPVQAAQTIVPPVE